jgi:hypothetical protein
MGSSRPWRLVIRKHNPGGMSGHGTTEVQSIAAGFDWEAGRVVITPAKPLTELSPEQIAAIEKSVREGGSWHAYQAQVRLRDRIKELEAGQARAGEELKARDELLRAAVPLLEAVAGGKHCTQAAGSLVRRVRDLLEAGVNNSEVA